MEEQHCDRTSGTDGVHETSEPAQPTPSGEPEAPPAPPVPVEAPAETEPTPSQPVEGEVNPAALDLDPDTQPEPEQPIDPADVAPDADEPGDDLPQDLAGHVHEGDVVPDNVDQAEVQDQA